MSLSRRFALLAAAEAAEAWIVEDDYDGEFCYRGHPPPTLKSIDAGRPRHLCRHVLQDALPGAAPRLHPRAAGARRRVRTVHRAPIRPAFPRTRRRSSPISWTKGISPRTSAACESSMRSATRRCGGGRARLCRLLDVAPTKPACTRSAAWRPGCRKRRSPSAPGRARSPWRRSSDIASRPSTRRGWCWDISGVKPEDIRKGVQVLGQVLKEASSPRATPALAPKDAA